MDWNFERELISGVITTDKLERPDISFLKLIGDDIGLVLKNSSDSMNVIVEEYDFLAGRSVEGLKFLTYISGEGGSILGDIIGKEIFSLINEDSLEIFQELNTVTKKFDYFKDSLHKAIDLANDEVVHFKSANQDNPDKNKELGKFNLLAMLVDTDNYIHWGKIGDQILVTFSEPEESVLVQSDNEFTYQSNKYSVTTGYVKLKNDFFMIGNKNLLESYDIEKMKAVFQSNIDFKEKIKILTESIADVDPKRRISLGIIKN